MIVVIYVLLLYTRGGGGGGGRTPNKSQHKQLALETKILQQLLPGIEPATQMIKKNASQQQDAKFTDVGETCKAIF